MSLHNPELSENIRSTVPVIKLLLELYKEADKNGQEDLKIWADYALHWAVRRLEAFLPKVKVSKKAAEIAEKKKIGDISHYKWADQTAAKKMKDRKRNSFHYEHIYPVSELRRELEALNPITDEAILDIIGKVDIAWITKEECKKLGSHGKRTDKVSHAENFKINNIEFI